MKITLPVARLRTKFDGVFKDCEVGIEDLNDRVVISCDGQDLAYLDAENHSLWRLNPGLRERIQQQIRTMKLVRS